LFIKGAICSIIVQNAAVRLGFYPRSTVLGVGLNQIFFFRGYSDWNIFSEGYIIRFKRTW